MSCTERTLYFASVFPVFPLNLGLFNGYKVGTNRDCEVTMLQFVGDTVFVGEASIKNAVVLKAILRCFELTSGLNVNFNKSKLASIAVDPGLEQRFAAILNCKFIETPFVYLGIPIGARPDTVKQGTISLENSVVGCLPGVGKQSLLAGKFVLCRAYSPLCLCFSCL